MEKRASMGNRDPRYSVPNGRARRSGIPDTSRFLQLGTDNGPSEPNRRSWSSLPSNGNDQTSGTENVLPTWYYIGILSISIGLILILLAIGSGV